VNKLTRRARPPLAACLLLVLAAASADVASAQLRDPGSTGGTAPKPGRATRGHEPLLPVAVSGYVFPIRGPHSYGTAINRFGAPRSGHTHQGQDVLAPAGTPLVAARGGRVTHRAFQAAAGNYLVIATDDGTDHVYMHLLAPAKLRPGQTVRAGQPIGRVGQTGDATAPHLHFEVWTAHWWDGGRPLDPLPRLRAWDALS
jgi:murein DD-endopeptidase MepM/ murein hydrolase activator NlpD